LHTTTHRLAHTRTRFCHPAYPPAVVSVALWFMCRFRNVSLSACLSLRFAAMSRVSVITWSGVVKGALIGSYRRSVSRKCWFAFVVTCNVELMFFDNVAAVEKRVCDRETINSLSDRDCVVLWQIPVGDTSGSCYVFTSLVVFSSTSARTSWNELSSPEFTWSVSIATANSNVRMQEKQRHTQSRNRHTDFRKLWVVFMKKNIITHTLIEQII